ncbi:hypothetical protein WK32_00320, partial [Burkholderia vietnamiensis]
MPAVACAARRPVRAVGLRRDVRERPERAAVLRIAFAVCDASAPTVALRVRTRGRAAVCAPPAHRRASPIDPLISTQEQNMTDVVIVSAARTAVGKFGGSLAKVAA